MKTEQKVVIWEKRGSTAFKIHNQYDALHTNIKQRFLFPSTKLKRGHFCKERMLSFYMKWSMIFTKVLWCVWYNAVVARQPKIKHFHGYARLSGTVAWLQFHGNQQKDVRCFYWASQVLYREDKTHQEISSVPSASSKRSVQCPQWVERDRLVSCEP
jgi:hypothetical protein